MGASLDPVKRSPLSSIFSPFSKPPLRWLLRMLPPDSSPSPSWRVMALRQHNFLLRQGSSLTELIASTQRECLQAWPLGHGERRGSQDQPAALILPNSAVQSFQLICQADWGPRDIEAECSLEAAALLQCAVTDINMDFKAASMPDGSLLAQVMVCQQNKVSPYRLLLPSLGLRLESVTSQAHSSCLVHTYQVPQLALNSLLCES